jgi:hypothetical protein
MRIYTIRVSFWKSNGWICINYWCHSWFCLLLCEALTIYIHKSIHAFTFSIKYYKMKLGWTNQTTINLTQSILNTCSLRATRNTSCFRGFI